MIAKLLFTNIDFLQKAEFLNDCTEKSLQIAERERDMVEIGT